MLNLIHLMVSLQSNPHLWSQALGSDGRKSVDASSQNKFPPQDVWTPSQRYLVRMPTGDNMELPRLVGWSIILLALFGFIVVADGCSRLEDAKDGHIYSR